MIDEPFPLAPPLSVSQWFNTVQPLSLEALRGRVVVLHAFQMLCPGCVAHGIPQAQAVHRQFAGEEVAVLGLLENMAVHTCSSCGHAEHIFGEGGGARMAETYGVPLLGSLPLEGRIREQGDVGFPLVVAQPDSTAAQAYRDLAGRLLEELEKRPRAKMSISASLL